MGRLLVYVGRQSMEQSLEIFFVFFLVVLQSRLAMSHVYENRDTGIFRVLSLSRNTESTVLAGEHWDRHDDYNLRE